jgi:hypothetical protein
MLKRRPAIVEVAVAEDTSSGLADCEGGQREETRGATHC